MGFQSMRRLATRDRTADDDTEYTDRMNTCDLIGVSRHPSMPAKGTLTGAVVDQG
jgi:hypothetical protein